MYLSRDDVCMSMYICRGVCMCVGVYVCMYVCGVYVHLCVGVYACVCDCIYIGTRGRRKPGARKETSNTKGN